MPAPARLGRAGAPARRSQSVGSAAAAAPAIHNPNNAAAIILHDGIAPLSRVGLSRPGAGSGRDGTMSSVGRQRAPRQRVLDTPRSRATSHNYTFQMLGDASPLT